MAALPKTAQAETMLSIRGLRVQYGGIQAVKGIDLEIRSGELVTLIGANGAGKTTTLKAISGLLPPSAGRMVFEGEDITRAVLGQIIFEEDTGWNRILHNETAFMIQRRLQHAGVPMIVLPVQLDLKPYARRRPRSRLIRRRADDAGDAE